MTNLLHETREAITNSGHSIEQISFIGSADGKYRMTWDQFTEVADAEYHSGFGGAEVATDLIVLFVDGKRMWRGEYDGSEWWEFDPPVSVDYNNAEAKPITRLIGGLWTSLAELNPDRNEPCTTAPSDRG